jgi:hypothetical protein
VVPTIVIIEPEVKPVMDGGDEDHTVLLVLRSLLARRQDSRRRPAVVRKNI